MQLFGRHEQCHTGANREKTSAHRRDGSHFPEREHQQEGRTIDDIGRPGEK